MELILSKNAEKEYKKLPKSDQKKVYRKLQVVEKTPTDSKKLFGQLAGIYSVRVWPYRILFQINEREQRIEVLKIAHRQSVYK
jgi:mRNA-degrading endonuclease RelE of RelBE toxin-antitoxin system